MKDEMSTEISRIWLSRDRQRVAIEYDNSGVATVLDACRPVHPLSGMFVNKLMPCVDLPTDKWIEISPGTDFE